jgi:transcriptional regulator with XRE-family HTH domain
MSVGSNIKKRRYELRMSQQELADAMGYRTRSTIAKIESGENDVSQRKLMRFASVLDTTVEALISGISTPRAFADTPPAQQKNHNIAVILAGGKTGKNQQNIPSQFISVYGKPVIASHSNAYGVYGHSRNLRDRHFLAIRELGGIVGISLCPQHLTDTSLRPAAAEDILRHIEHYLALGGEDMIGFGADWDGTDLPDGIDHVGHLTRVAECMAAHGYSDSLIRKLFWDNFYRFSIKNL